VNEYLLEVNLEAWGLEIIADIDHQHLQKDMMLASISKS